MSRPPLPHPVRPHPQAPPSVRAGRLVLVARRPAGPERDAAELVDLGDPDDDGEVRRRLDEVDDAQRRGRLAPQVVAAFRQVTTSRRVRPVELSRRMARGRPVTSMVDKVAVWEAYLTADGRIVRRVGSTFDRLDDAVRAVQRTRR